MIENENENKHPVNKTEYLLKPLGLDPIGYTASGEQVFHACTI